MGVNPVGSPLAPSADRACRVMAHPPPGHGRPVFVAARGGQDEVTSSSMAARARTGTSATSSAKIVSSGNAGEVISQVPLVSSTTLIG
jgi:hypothetical protein